MIDFDPTTDWTPPDETECEAIREHFDRGRARAHTTPSPLFAGRDEFVRGVRAELRELRQSPTPLPNLTWAAHGAPGAGKSEALLNLAAEFSQWVEGDSPVLTVWTADPDSLTDPIALGAAVYAAAGRSPNQIKTKLAGMEAGATLGVLKGMFKFDRRDRQATAPLWRVADEINQECGNPTILLLVDEAQVILEGAVASGIPTFAMRMHAGKMAGLKILPVYGGLGNTVKMLGKAGVSRLDIRHAQQMRPLPGNLAGDMCRKALCALTNPPDKTAVDRWAAGIVRLCEGWPMHLTHCFLAVRERHRAASGRTFTDEDFSVAMEGADALRREYYDTRLSSCDGLDPDHYEAWGRLFAGGAMANPAKVAKALALSKPEAKDLLDQALRAGLVETTAPQLYKSPIRSMARHTVDTGRIHASYQPPRPAPDFGR